MFPNPYYGCSPFYTFAIQNFPFLEKDFDALNDYQMMCQIFKYLNDKIKEVDEKYGGIFETVEKLEVDFETFKNEVNQTIQTFKTEVLNDVDLRLNNQYIKILDLLNQYQIVFRAYVDSQINTVNQRIDEIEVGAVNIYNPLTGLIEPVGDVINDLYNQLRYNAITCDEYDGLELTATTYDGYMITANNFDLNGKNILMGN
jgi:hypothetical protein